MNNISAIKSITATAFIFILLVSACSSAKYARTEKPHINTISVETIDLSFETPLSINAPEASPITVEEHIRTGLFYFETGRYSLSTIEFEQVLQGISNHRNPLYRNSLISIAVCKLLSDDKSGFFNIIRELKSTYTKYELVVINDKDNRVSALFSLYDELINNGNF